MARPLTEKIIITCAVTGSVHTPTMSRYLPITPQQITHAALMGGNVRVGLEDSLYLGRGEHAQSNADQVRNIRSILGPLGIEFATPDEAREMLGLKGRAGVNLP